MIWYIHFGFSVLILLSSLILALFNGITRKRKNKILDPTKILFAGIVASATFMFIPLYVNEFKSVGLQTGIGIIETILISIHNVIRLFVVDGEFSFVTDNIGDLHGWFSGAYSGLFAVLFVLAPLMTFSFVLSFFKNIVSYIKLIFHYNSNVYVFSELNERSIALATSLYNNKKENRFIVFADAFKDTEIQEELTQKAAEIKAAMFKKEITAINFSVHNKSKSLNFFVINSDDEETINQSLNLISYYKLKKNTNLYVFTGLIEAEMLIAGALNEDDGKPCIKVRRINEVQSLVNRILYDEGYEKIYCSAVDGKDGKKNISAVVVGMGHHGIEMTKALSWFCQMNDYRVEINSFDKKENISGRFTSLCPELMDKNHNGNFTDYGEAQYKITVHDGADMKSESFDKVINSIENITYIFIALGNDELNISTAVKLRALCLRRNLHPVIQAVVYNNEKKKALSDIRNFKGESYDIDFIGDTESSYSEEVILDSDVEEAALARHLKWSDDETPFWKFDYNYKSSIASAIHRKAKILCKVPGIEKQPEERTEEESMLLRVIEHRRWNAYMRSDGYSYSGSKEKSSRNDMAKLHNCLVTFSDLPYEEQIKDDD